MAERSYPFDGGDGAFISEADWEAMASVWQDDGIIGDPSGAQLSITSQGVAGTLTAVAGRAVIRGFHYSLDANMGVSYTLNTHASLSRPDLVVLRLDRGLNKVAVAVKEGVPGGSTPTPTTSETVYEMPLASVSVPPNSAPVVQSGITDVRGFVSRGVRVVRNGAVPTEPGSLYYSSSSGRVRVVTPKAGTPGVMEDYALPRGGEVAPLSAAGSEQYPIGAPQGTMVWDSVAQSLMVLNGSGAWVAVGAGGGGPAPGTPYSAFKRRGTDLVVTGSTAVEDPLLKISIQKNDVFHFEGALFYRGAANNAASTLQLNHPDVGAGSITTGFDYHDGTTTTPRRQVHTTAVPALGAYGAPVAGTLYLCRVFGTFSNTTGSFGDLSFTYTLTSGTITILKGSYLKVSTA
ncbi:hypothetical protein [Nonomuraea roseola]|uniref:Minor tail protein n=1 Tax=Nonomuraea roseola TaxID=46179 RepID=A0ABV5Q0P4_9ACTN